MLRKGLTRVAARDGLIHIYIHQLKSALFPVKPKTEEIIKVYHCSFYSGRDALFSFVLNC